VTPLLKGEKAHFLQSLFIGVPLSPETIFTGFFELFQGLLCLLPAKGTMLAQVWPDVLDI
jgi:hypothetical protein